MAETPDSEEQGAATEIHAPRQIVVHAQYIKDLSFENPNAPDILIDPPSKPDVEIGVNVGARGLNIEQYEVMLSLSARAKAGEKSLFLAELSHHRPATQGTLQPRYHNRLGGWLASRPAGRDGPKQAAGWPAG